MTFSFTLNGETVAPADFPAHLTLLDWLRESGRTGSKEGCAEGECGACAVLLARPEGTGTCGDTGTRWDSVNACLLPLAALDGQELVSVEGLAPSRTQLHPVQRALAEGGGSQCGYCTPGFAVSLAAEYYRERGEGEPPDIHALSGNLCRCTGYRPIRDAAASLGRPQAGDPLAERRRRPAPAPAVTHLRLPGGEFHRPATLQEALERLSEHPGSRVLAGGTDWGVEVNLRHSRAGITLAVDGLPELLELREEGGMLQLGAGLSLAELQRRLGGRVPLLSQLFPQFASPLIRNRATLGGNLGTASPIGDSLSALLALDAQVVLVGLDAEGSVGERAVPLSEYFLGYRQTARRPEELIRAVRLPLPLLPVTRFYKVAKRRADDISAVSAALALRLDGGVVGAIRIGLGGVAATPIRALEVERALTGARWDEATVRRAARLMLEAGTPLSDVRASAEYRRALLEGLLLKFWFETRDGAEGGPGVPA